MRMTILLLRLCICLHCLLCVSLSLTITLQLTTQVLFKCLYNIDLYSWVISSTQPVSSAFTSSKFLLPADCVPSANTRVVAHQLDHNLRPPFLHSAVKRYQRWSLWLQSAPIWQKGGYGALPPRPPISGQVTLCHALKSLWAETKKLKRQQKGQQTLLQCCLLSFLFMLLRLRTRQDALFVYS